MLGWLRRWFRGFSWSFRGLEILIAATDFQRFSKPRSTNNWSPPDQRRPSTSDQGRGGWRSNLSTVNANPSLRKPMLGEAHGSRDSLMEYASGPVYNVFQCSTL